MDMDTILTSVKKTGKCVVAHEAVGNAGLGAEISARIIEQAFSYLDAPIKRITGKNCMVPYCKVLEDEVLPQLADVEKAIRDLANF
jgi:pyruvate/2-oxoglutarate/acetoin dehydrogenase E1 component